MWGNNKPWEWVRSPWGSYGATTGDIFGCFDCEKKRNGRMVGLGVSMSYRRQQAGLWPGMPGPQTIGMTRICGKWGNGMTQGEDRALFHMVHAGGPAYCGANDIRKCPDRRMRY